MKIEIKLTSTSELSIEKLDDMAVIRNVESQMIILNNTELGELRVLIDEYFKYIYQRDY